MAGRLDERGVAYAGSQLQMQIYVNRRSPELSQNVLDALPSLASLDVRLNWASPLLKEKCAEYKDRAFLSAVRLEHCYEALRGFWPRGGPVWDALAAVEFDKARELRGVVLVEAKSYPGEVYGPGCQASPRSRKRIEAALGQAKRWFGVSGHSDWTGPLYQSANRLAHLYFLREVAGVPAWLVNVYFLNDSHSPTTHGDWQLPLSEVQGALGLGTVVVPYAGKLFLEARDRSELSGWVA